MRGKERFLLVGLTLAIILVGIIGTCAVWGSPGTAKKGRKLKPVKVSESVIRRSKLWQMTLEHKYISSILRESEKWLRYAEIRNPKIDRAAVLEKLVSREKDLALQIKKLRETIGVSPSIPYIDVKMGLPSDWDFDDWGLPDPWDREAFLEKVKKYMIIAEYVQSLQRGPADIYVLPDECAPQSGLIEMVDDPQYLDIVEPSFSTTESYKSFTVLRTDNYVGVSFADMYIDVPIPDPDDPEAIPYYDSFDVATILKFEFPPAPCDGMLYFYLKGQIAFSPEIDGDSPFVWYQQMYRFNREGDGFDYTNPQEYSLTHSLRTTTPVEGVIRTNFDLDFRDVGFEVSEGEKGVLRLAIRIRMGVGGGRSSFSQNGDHPVGYVVVLRPPGATVPGVSYNFQPEE